MTAPWLRGNRGDSITRWLPRAVAACAAVLVLLAPAPQAATPAVGQFASSVSLVEVYASVVDANGQPVRGLTADDFEVFEDGQPQKVAAFAAGDFPLTAALALDRSFSMAGRPLASVQSAARAFLGALRSSDEAVLLGVGSEVTLLAETGASRAEQVEAVGALTPWGTTSLHDAIIAAIDAVDGASGRRALVILSDGDDRYSQATAAEAIARARRSNVMVYPIALGRSRPPLFAELSTLTGGRSYHVRNYEGLDETLRTIASQLREQYLLGYSPAQTSGADGGWRSITVRVRRPGVSVRARDGYYLR